MPRPKGLPKTGGRKKGTPNRKTSLVCARRERNEDRYQRHEATIVQGLAELYLEYLDGAVILKNLLSPDGSEILIMKGTYLNKDVLQKVPQCLLPFIEVNQDLMRQMASEVSEFHRALLEVRRKLLRSQIGIRRRRQSDKN